MGSPLECNDVVFKPADVACMEHHCGNGDSLTCGHADCNHGVCGACQFTLKFTTSGVHEVVCWTCAARITSLSTPTGAPLALRMHVPQQWDKWYHAQR